MCPTYLLGVAPTPPVLGSAVSPSEPVIWESPQIARLLAMVLQAQEE